MLPRFAIGRVVLMRWLRAVAQSSTVLGIAMIGLVWASVGFHLTSERQSAEQAAIENAGNLARAFEAHLSQSLHDIDRTLDMMRSYYLRDPANFDFRAWAESAQPFDKDLVHLSIVGPDGRLLASSIPDWTPVDLGDREHFKIQATARDDKLFISRPVLGRASRRLSIQLSRRIERPDGSFGGIIVAMLDPSYFARLYDLVEVGAEGYVRVIGTDGIIRAAGGSVREEPGRDLGGSLLFQKLATQRDRMVLHRQHPDRSRPPSPGVPDRQGFSARRRARPLDSKEIFAAVSAKGRSYNFVAGLLTAADPGGDRPQRARSAFSSTAPPRSCAARTRASTPRSTTCRTA